MSYVPELKSKSKDRKKAQIMPIFALMMTMFIAMMGLMIDGSFLLRLRADMQLYADTAAHIGAQYTNVNSASFRDACTVTYARANNGSCQKLVRVVNNGAVNNYLAYWRGNLGGPMAFRTITSGSGLGHSFGVSGDRAIVTLTWGYRPLLMQAVPGAVRPHSCRCIPLTVRAVARAVQGY